MHCNKYFNSIKVRLERSEAEERFRCPPYFNSIKVRLELKLSTDTTAVLAQFQFHKGTIRTITGFLEAKWNGYFNSIKVRLELTFLIVICLRLRYFNSIKVRLELEAAGINPYLMLEFQFHKGTIRTAIAVQKYKEIQYFNSIKVRLELNIAKRSIVRLPHFNSIKVRLEQYQE